MPFIDAISALLEDWIFPLFKEKAVAYSLTLTMLTVLIATILWFLSIEIRRRKLQLDGISNSLRSLSGERELTSAYGDLKQRVETIPWLKHAWGEFEQL